MTADPPSAERIERLQKRRTRLAFIQGAFFLIWQANFFSLYQDGLSSGRLVDHVKIAAYIFWVVALLTFLATGGGLAQSRQTRAILNDESTIEHRRRAFTVGFWLAMLTCLALYVVNLFFDVTAGEALHAVLSLAIGGGLLTFARLERRAQQDG